VSIYTDFHGHSKKRNIFLFGCCGNPGDSNANKINSAIKTFPYLASQTNKMISYKDCKFACEKEKESTARIVVFKELSIINSYTLEASFYKADCKTLSKFKLENGFKQRSNSNTCRTANDSFHEIDDHFEICDFVNGGKDFIKTIAIAATNSVLK
jgi:hypothetical protein